MAAPATDATPPSGKAGASKGMAFLLGGLVAIVAGLVLFGYGLAPLKAFGVVMDVFGGGQPPDDLPERIEGAIAAAKARAWADILGLILLLGGFICAKMAFRKPKPKPVEELIQEEVNRRLGEAPAGSGFGGASSWGTHPTAGAGGTAVTAAVVDAPQQAPHMAAPTLSSHAALAAEPVMARPVAAVVSQAAPAGRRCRWCSSAVASDAKRCPLCGNKP